MTKSKKITNGYLLTIVVILGLELLLCGIEQFALSRSYSIYYAVITSVYTAIQIIYCLNIDTFANGRKGIRDFFIYKAVKLFIVILPLFIYVVITETVNVWIPIRVAAYYFTFLIIETALTAKQLKGNKSQTATAEND